MKMKFAVLLGAVLIGIPAVLLAEGSPVIDVTSSANIQSANDSPADLNASPSIQPKDESSVIIIVNPTQEQILSADKQLLSSNPQEDAVKTEDPTSEEEVEDGVEALADAAEPTFDIPVTMNDKVEMYLHYFSTRLRDKFSTWLARSEMYLPMMKKTFREKGLPEDLTYLALIESGFNNKAYSRSRAAGQWQFMKATGKRYGLRIDNWMDERRDPEKATEAASRYLTDLYVLFNDWHLAAASYNAGEGKIGRAIHKYKTVDFWQLSQKKNRYLKRETKDYVPKLIAAAMIAKNPARYGFNDIEFLSPLQYEKVSINRVMDLRDIAKVLDYEVTDLKLLNPALKTNLTPPRYDGYELKVPVGKKAELEDKMASIPPVRDSVILAESKIAKKDNDNKRQRVSRKKIISYIVKDGDTIGAIAARFKVQAKLLATWNNLLGRGIRAGDKLKIYVEKSQASGKKLS